MSLDPLLLDLLACPIDKQALLYLPGDDLPGDGVLYNPRLRRSYQVTDGIPVLLADQGSPVTDEQHASLLRRAAAGEADGTATATLRIPLRDLLRDLLSEDPLSDDPLDDDTLSDGTAGLPAAEDSASA
ncbi:MAG: hypothetical protein J2P25_16790 [Nocardiopsaceae bacterium]|nr:hypothetical protein [Nocardiopsaceae bacterium]